MSHTAPPTIISLKTNFLSAQTRALSNPLHPSRAWQTTNEELPDKAVNDVMAKLNNRVLQHCKRVYAPQATRHVAEQIEALYISSSYESLELEGDGGEGEGVREGEDLGTYLYKNKMMRERSGC